MINSIILILTAFISGGGLVAVLNNLFNRKLTKSIELENEAKADGIAVTTLKEAINTLNESVYRPIREENEKLKVELKKISYEITKFRKAIERISSCTYADQCPITLELQSKPTSDGSSNKNGSKGN